MKPSRVFLHITLAAALFAGAQALAADTTVPERAPLSSADRTFLIAATTTGLAVVEFSALAVAHSKNGDVVEFARTMIDDHSAANAALSDLARRRGWSLPTDLGSSKKGQFDHLTQRSGAAFDARYVHIMIADHKVAMKLFEKAAREVTDPELRAYAAGLLVTLRHHGAMADDLKQRLEQTQRAAL